MDGDRVFMDAAQQPTDASVSEALGEAREFFDRILALTGDFAATWGFTKGSGWALKVADKKKALLYVVPLADMFRLSMTLRELERDELLGRKALESLHPAMREARKFSEGYALYFAIDGPDECGQVELLVSAVIALRR